MSDTEAEEAILFRVRDLDTAKGPGKIWGENLDIDAARELKESIAGARMSRTVFIEPMSESVEPPTSTPAAAAPRPVPRIVRAEEKPTEAPFFRMAHQTAEAAAAELAARAQRRSEQKQKLRALAQEAGNLPPVPTFDEGDLGETSSIDTDIPEGEELDDAAISDLLDGTDDGPGADNIQ